MKHFSDRLLAAIERCGAPVCVGIDPHIDRIPRKLIEQSRRSYTHPRDILIEAVAAFCMPLLEALRESGIAVIKPQAAFFETLGPGGLAVFEAVCQRAQELEMVVIGDAKRGDIGSTSSAYAAAWLGGTHVHGLRARPFSVDAMTVNPYLGGDGVVPFIDAAEKTGRGVFVLLKTSNPGSADIQDLELASGDPVYIELAKRFAEWSKRSIGDRGYSNVGAVVGATQPEAARRLRVMLPKTIFLVPGYGAQGAGASELEPFFNADGLGAIVNSSRGVIHAYGTSDVGDDWVDHVRRAAKALIDDVGAVVRK